MPAASKTSRWRCLELSKTLFYSLHRRNAGRLLSSRNGEAWCEDSYGGVWVADVTTCWLDG